jgi:hypothetical protein
MEMQIKAASDICHQSTHHAAFIIYPPFVKGLSFEQNLKVKRRIEDRCLKEGLDIETEVLLTCTIPEKHGNERRKLGLVGRVGVSARVGRESKWLNSEACQGGKIEGVPLSRLKDSPPISLPNSVGASDYHSWSATERAALKGGPACRYLIEALVQDMKMDPATDKLIIVDLICFLNADWAFGVWSMQQDWMAASSGKLLTAYIGMWADAGYQQAAQQHLEQTLLNSWWFASPESGPAEPALNIDLLVEKPTLQLASWTGSKPVLPPYVINKFEPDDPYHSKWSEVCTSFAANMAKLEDTLGGPDKKLPDGLALTSPDWSVPPAAPDLSMKLCPETVPAAEFKMDNVCRSWRQKPSTP